MCFISFIVPVYNLRQIDVSECISSLIHQTYSANEIILVDDGSNNGIESYCDSLKERYDIRVIHQKNQGLAVARNTGMNEARGKWIVHVDGDDWVDIHLAEYLKEKDKTSNADIIVWGFVIDNGIKRQELLLKNKQAFDENYKMIKENILCSIMDCDNTFSSLSLNTSWAKAYRSEYIKKHSLYYDNRLRRAQDAVYNLKAFYIASKVDYIDHALNFYRTNNLSLSRGYNPKTFDYLLLTALAVKEFVDGEEVSLRVKEASNIFIQRCFRMINEQYYQHKDNPMTFKERKKLFVSGMEIEPFKKAFSANVYRKGFLFKVEDYLYRNQLFLLIAVYNRLLKIAMDIKRMLNK